VDILASSDKVSESLFTCLGGIALFCVLRSTPPRSSNLTSVIYLTYRMVLCVLDTVNSNTMQLEMCGKANSSETIIY